MKLILILAILLIAVPAITLTSEHSAQIFYHDADTKAPSAPSQPVAASPAPATAQTNAAATAPKNPPAATQTTAPAAQKNPPAPTTTPASAGTSPQPANAATTNKTFVPTTPSKIQPASSSSKPSTKGKSPAADGKGAQQPNPKGGNTKPGPKGGNNVTKPVAPKPAGPFFSKDLTLTLDYATRQQTCFYSAHFEIYWNGKKIQQIIPNDYDVHSLSFRLQAKPGKNVLAFAGTGISDGRGATLSNVKLIRKSSFGLQDLVENGDFKEGFTVFSGSKIYKNSIPGWKGKQIQIGKGDFYNKNWNNQIVVTELDANQNTRIEQSFFFLDNYQVFYEVDPKDLSA